jgi:hypothetical protein
VRISPSLALLFFLTAAVCTRAQETMTPPVPVAGNAPPTFPRLDAPEPIEAIVTVRADVDASGIPTRVNSMRVQVLGAPATKRDEIRALFDAEARRAVGAWRFTPARRGNDPVDGIFVSDLTFVAPGTIATARMYATSSSNAWTAVRNALNRLKVGTHYVSDEHHYLTTKWIGMTTPAGRIVGDLGLGADVKVNRFMLVAFVSPFVEPARVHVRSVVDVANRGRRGSQFLLYNLPAASQLVFRELENVATSRPLPISQITRAQIASALAPERSPCATGLSAEQYEAAPTQLPRRLFDWAPSYPADSLAKHRNGIVGIEGHLFEDGTLLPIAVLNRPADDDLTAAALGAASLWHFTPASTEGCTRPLDIAIEIQFSIRP